MAATAAFKLVLLGETAVGKSSIALRFCRSEFHEFQESTIGAAYMTQSVTVGNEPVRLDIWDTAGQERYRSLAPMYYRGAAAAIVVYDICNYDTFVRAKHWVKELKMRADSGIVIALAGNKCDLSERRRVDLAEAQTYAKEQDVIIMETSAKSGTNVTEIFTAVAAHLPRSSVGVTEGTVPLRPRAPQRQRKCC
eukprot:TRINITY_DN47756_c0_g1_i1.p1 TRINITY_DN47756_c0_g1~~TRINITY_DN47756_c0_g1_i1.p1  ORF type:complete len:213 (-),score=33.37 TRINITY_DN47756_c0_g1_i1:92-673(-)